MKNKKSHFAYGRGVRRFPAALFFMLVLSAVLALCTAGNASAADTSARVIDQAGLFSDTEKAELETAVQATIKKIGMDVVVVTVKNKNGKTTQAYEDDYYREGGYGVGTGRSGFIYLIDMEDRKIDLSTAGGAISLITDKRYNAILDDAFKDVSAQDYAGSVQTVLADTQKYYTQSLKAGYTYDKESGAFRKKKSLSPLEALLSLLAAFAVAGGYCLNIKNQYEMKQEKKGAVSSMMAYRLAAAFVFALAADDLIEEHTTQRVIQTQHSSGGSGDGPFGHTTTHTDSGGMTHGGGSGRSF